MRLTKLGLLGLLIIILSTTVFASKLVTTYNPYTSKLDYYMQYTTDDFSVNGTAPNPYTIIGDNSGYEFIVPRYVNSTHVTNSIIYSDDFGVAIGTPTFGAGTLHEALVVTSTNQIAGFSDIGDINDYHQLKIKNANSGQYASIDYILEVSDSNETYNYGDLGKNGPNWNDDEWTINGVNDLYLFDSDNDVSIGTLNPDGKVNVWVGDSLIENERLSIMAGEVKVGDNNLYIDSLGSVMSFNQETNTSHESTFSVTGKESSLDATIQTYYYNETEDYTYARIIGVTNHEAFSDASQLIFNNTHYYVTFINETDFYIPGNVTINSNNWTYKQAPYIDVSGGDDEERGFSVSRYNPITGLNEWIFSQGITYDSNNSEYCFYSSKYESSKLFCLTDTGDVNVLGTLSSNNINLTSTLSLDKLHMNTNYTASTHEIGDIHWDPQHMTMEIDVGNDTHLQVGQEQYIQAVNDEDFTIPNGKAVYIVGAQGNRPAVRLADNSDLTASQVIGVATQDIPKNEYGFITISGKVNDIDTSEWAVNSTIYLNGNGTLTNETPVHPKHSVLIGKVLVSHSQHGTILVAIRNGYLTTNLHDVKQTTPTTTHQVLMWNQTSLLYEPRLINTYTDTLYYNKSYVDTLGNASTKASPGTCPVGQFVQNTTLSGVQCGSVAGAGTVTQVNTGVYTQGGPITASGTIEVNMTAVINAIGNSSKLVGTCGVGQVVQNISINGPQCYTPTGSTYTNGTGLLLTGTQFNISDLYLQRYNETGLVSSVGNWSADKSSYTLLTYTQSIGNWSADKTSYNTTVQNHKLFFNMSYALGDGNISSASTWNAKAGTGTCPAGSFVQNTTTGGVQCATASASITGGNCPEGQVVQNITTAGVPQCVPDQTGTGGGSVNNTDINVSNLYVVNGAYIYGTNEVQHTQMYFCDFTPAAAATMCYPNYLGAGITSGTSTSIAGSEVNKTIGVVTLRSTTAISTGYYYVAGATTLVLNGSEEFKFHIAPHPTKTGNNASIVRAGFIDTLTAADQVDGAYWEFVSNSTGYFAFAKQASNSVRNTSAVVTITGQGPWFYGKIKVNPTVTNVTYSLYNNTGALISKITLTGATTLPRVAGRETGFGITGYATVAPAVIQEVAHVDYIMAEVERPARILI